MAVGDALTRGVRVEYCPLMVSDIRTIRILKHISKKPVGLHYQRTKYEFPQYVFHHVVVLSTYHPILVLPTALAQTFPVPKPPPSSSS